LASHAAHALRSARTRKRSSRSAAWAAWEAKDRTASLCCGLAGRAYGLLALHQATGVRAWLARARDLAAGAAALIREQASPRDSLFRGEPGIAVLAAEIDRPELAAMPLFGGGG
jgi:serine/threonine-protein kinase